MSRRHCHSARCGTQPSNCALSNNERHPKCKKHNHTHSTRDRYATGDRRHCHSISSHSATNQLRSLERHDTGYLRFSYDGYTSLNIYKAEAVECCVVIVAAPVVKHDQENCALSNHERHHGCQNAPTSCIPHKIPMYENLMLSRHHCHSTCRGARPSNCTLSNNERHRGCQKRSHTNIYSLVHAIGMLPRAYHHCHSTCRETRPCNCALSNDKRPAAALSSPMTLKHFPIYKT